jgi:hypothetical protein
VDRTPKLGTLANFSSVIIGDNSLRPILDVNKEAGLVSRLFVRVPNGPTVCVELAPRQTKILLALASAWHDDEHLDTTDAWRRGYRTFDALGEIYAKLTGDRAAIFGEAVRKYASQMTTKVRKAALSEDVLPEVIRKLGIIRRPPYGYQVSDNGIEIRGL